VTTLNIDGQCWKKSYIKMQRWSMNKTYYFEIYVCKKFFSLQNFIFQKDNFKSQLSLFIYSVCIIKFFNLVKTKNCDVKEFNRNKLEEKKRLRTVRIKLTVVLWCGTPEALQLLPTLVITVREESSVNYGKREPGLMHRAESPRV